MVAQPRHGGVEPLTPDVRVAGPEQDERVSTPPDQGRISRDIDPAARPAEPHIRQPNPNDSGTPPQTARLDNDPDRPIQIHAKEAGQATKPHMTRYVLGFGLPLVVIGFAIAYVVGAWS